MTTALSSDVLVEPGFGPVADAFRANFDDHDDVGAACCVYLDGRPVVDLWGGVADRASGRATVSASSPSIASLRKARSPQ